MNHFDHDAIRAAAREYATGVQEINENTRRQRARTRKITGTLRVAATALSYVGAFCDGIVAGNKR